MGFGGYLIPPILLQRPLVTPGRGKRFYTVIPVLLFLFFADRYRHQWLNPHSLLAPAMCDVSQDYVQNFVGMSGDDISLDHLRDLPAVKWREKNLDRAGAGTCEELLRKLDEVL